MIDRFDHIVLTVGSMARTLRFYADGLGMRTEVRDGRTALLFGRQKINLHEAEALPILPRARRPTPGSADVCLVANCPIEVVLATLGERGLVVDTGPVERQGALGPMRSVYLRDPDGNLVEISAYPEAPLR